MVGRINGKIKKKKAACNKKHSKSASASKLNISDGRGRL